MHVLIVDDEPLARQRLAQLVLELHPDTPVLQAGSTAEAAQCLARHPQDIALVLLDIEMPGGSGLDWINDVKQRTTPPAVIMTTAFSEYALPAIQRGADGYLLKPIKRSELATTLERVRKPHRWQQATGTTAALEPRVCLNQDGTGDYLNRSDIHYCQAEERWVRVVTARGEWVSDRPLKEWETLMGEHGLRIHRSYVLNPVYLQALRRHDSQYQVVLINGHLLPVSRRHAQAVRQRLRAGAGAEPLTPR